MGGGLALSRGEMAVVGFGGWVGWWRGAEDRVVVCV